MVMSHLCTPVHHTAALVYTRIIKMTIIKNPKRLLHRPKRIAILGFGREGQSLLKFLKQDAAYRNAEIAILDQKLKKDYLQHLTDFDLIFRSPGIPYTLPEIKAAKKAGVAISSPTKLFFEILGRKTKIIGITGSKGKSTTSTLLYQILKRAGCNVILAGNIGTPMLEMLQKAKKVEYVILELSSFQLQDLTISPSIAVVLDIFPEHLDQHKTLGEYIAAKGNIGRFQKKTDVLFYFADNTRSRAIAKKSSARTFSIRPNKHFLDQFNLDSRHTRISKNFEMAALVARFLNIPKQSIANAIKNFRGLEHRLEFVRTIHGISFIDDSAATNPEATAAAIRSYTRPLILIAGGKDKKLDYAPVAHAIKKSPQVKAIILYGENKNKIKHALRKNKKYALGNETDLKSALQTAYQYAKTLVAHDRTLNPLILLSPASASFDQFKNYGERGTVFKKAVRTLR